MVVSRAEFLANGIELKSDFEQFPDHRPKLAGSHYAIPMNCFADSIGDDQGVIDGVDCVV